MTVKPELKSDCVVVDPLNLLKQHLSSLQQQQQSVTSVHASQQQQQQHPNQSSSSSLSPSSSAATGNSPCTDVTWRQQQLRAIQHQLLLMQGLPAVMPTNISQPGSACSSFYWFVCSDFYYRMSC